jgi:hypothetical protein
MATPTDPLWQHLAGMTAAPFIPELHDDACDDTGCTGCRPPRSGIARLDVPAAEVAAEFVALKAKRLTECELLEQRHQLFDLDADSAFTIPGSCCPACPPREGDAS